MSETIFQEGDIVEHVITGARGVLVRGESLKFLRMRLLYDHRIKPHLALQKVQYLPDGRTHEANKNPSIMLIERPKKDSPEKDETAELACPNCGQHVRARLVKL